ncbi:MAG: thiamine phosphate synthase, partial [Rikenellaceae bacterium]
MLQFITHYNDHYDYLQGAVEALKGGCRWIQLRAKDLH